MVAVTLHGSDQDPPITVRLLQMEGVGWIKADQESYSSEAENGGCGILCCSKLLTVVDM